MTIQYYYNSAGEWIAFRRTIDDRYLFDRKGNWVAWFPWRDNEAVDVNGEYLGTVVDGNRFYARAKSKLDRPHPGFSVPPGPTRNVNHPGYAAYSAPPLGFTDVTFPRPNMGQRHKAKPRRVPPPPKPTPLQVWMSRLGISQAADKISRALGLKSASNGSNRRR